MSDTTEKAVEFEVPDHLVPLFTALKTYATDANKIAEKIKSVTGGQDEAVKVVLSSSDNPTIKAFREASAKWAEVVKANEEKLAQAKAAAEEIAKAEVSASAGGDDFNVEDATKEFLEGRRNATTMRKALLQLLGNDEKKLQDGYEKFGITEVVSLRQGGKAVGAKGSLKPRLSAATVDGKAIEPTTFTVLAKTVGVSLEAARAAAISAAGVEDLRDKAGVEIAFTLNDKAVVIVPKAAGNATAGVSAEETEDDENETED